MSRLPPGWEWTTVGKVGEVALGRQRSPQHHSGDYMRPYLRVANVFENRIDTSDIKEMNFTPEEFERFALRRGDILLNEGQSRELVGRPAMFRDEVPGACFQNTLVRFRAGEATLPEYALALFRLFFHNGQFQQICKWTTNIAHLGAERFASMSFPLAPLPEQKRIADKLDALLARVDACRERLDRVPNLLKAFRQAVLAAATSGELTEEWRQDCASAAGWRKVKLSDVASSRLGKMLDKSKNQGSPTVYLRNVNVRWFNFDLSDLQQIRVTPREAVELALLPGDVLVCEGGEPGRCAIWRETSSNYVYQKALHRVRVGSELTPEWLCYALKDASNAGRLAELFTGTTIKHLTGVALGNFAFQLPPVGEQHEIVRRVENLFAYADRLEVRYQAARAQVERLTPALLAKAFRGELVPQGPNDEPASMLLERIREQTASPIGQRRSGRTRGMSPRKEFKAVMKKLIDVLADAGDWMTAQDAFRGCGIADGSKTELIEGIYAELRELERTKRVAVEPIRDAQGRKIHDRLMLIAKA